MTARAENVSFDDWLTQMNADYNQGIDTVVDTAANATKIAGPAIIQNTADFIKEATGNNPVMNASIQLLSEGSKKCSGSSVEVSAKASKVVSKTSMDVSLSIVGTIGRIFC